MSKILVSDVFGYTTALHKLADGINADLIIDPFNGLDMDFECEADAYTYFMQNVGLDVYLLKLIDVIKFQVGTTLIGFSVGASVVWRLACQALPGTINHAIGYYGSQIRNYVDLEPTTQTSLIFPKYESHFDVEILKNIVSNKQHVQTIQVSSLHGFMNIHSDNFEPTTYQKQLRWLASL